jgi:hypothetical protein
MAPSHDIDVNSGASTSAASEALGNKTDKKKNLPWIEKYRPQKFDEIMGMFEGYSTLGILLKCCLQVMKIQFHVLLSLQHKETLQISLLL